MKKLLFLAALSFFSYACSENNSKQDTQTSSTPAIEPERPAYDTARGEGKFTNVTVSANLDKAMAVPGEKVYDVKCAACHKLSNEKLVGPGWLGVTNRHQAAWIMNFVTNVDTMLEKDPKAQALLELCMVRMPNQNLSDEDARNVYEFMRKNDGVK